MKKKDRPLPRPPKTPFGRKRAGEEGLDQELLADRMAEAAARGSLDPFLDRELPDSEHARALAKMMMGMTGMQQQEGRASPAGAEAEAEAPEASAEPSPDMPANVREAVQAGKVNDLIEILRQEHLKRSGSGSSQPAETAPAGTAPESPEREVLDRLIGLAREHSVSPDWVILRALKLYFEEYERTGRL